MEQIGDMKIYTFDEIQDEIIGKKGTPERDEYERELEEELRAYRVGEAIKQARLAQNMTQEQLGEKIGVQRAQISRLEKGHSISLSSMSRVFKALGIQTASLDLGAMGKVALW
jgi:ribosome-binding protein aMBF1 (putative translation factor)